MLYKSREAVIKLLNDYSSIASECNYKAIYGKGIPSMSACVAHNKGSDHSNLELLSPKQMLQRLPIALTQVRPGNTSENLLNEIIHELYILYIYSLQKKLLKKYLTI